MKALTLDPNHWDCECKENYIHEKKEEKCEKCGSIREEQPDSRVIEVLSLKYSKEKLIEILIENEIINCGLCKHQYKIINEPCQSCKNYSEWEY